MSRVEPLVLRAGDEKVLRGWLRSSTVSAGLAHRARIVVLAAEGHSNTEIGRRVGVSLPTVRLWRQRYATGGLEQLEDLPRSGRPPVHDEQVIIAATLEPPPAKLGVTHWSARLLADHLGVSFATVARIWRRWGPKPWKAETFKFSTDPELEAKMPDHVVDLLHEQWVGGQLEGVRPVRLEVERLPDPPDRRLRQPGALRHRRPRPVRRVGRGRLQRGHHDVLDLINGDRRRPARAGLIHQPVESVGHEPGAPLADRGRNTVQLRRNSLVVQTIRACQHDLRAQRQRLRRLRPPHQLRALLIAEDQLRFRPTCSRHTQYYNLSCELPVRHTSG